MANSPFDRTILNVRERPLSSDLNQAQSQMDYSLREMVMRAFSPRASLGSDVITPATSFHGDGFEVRPQSPVAMQVRVSAGLGFFYDPADVPAAIGSIVGLDDRSAFKPLSLLADAVINVPAAPGPPNSRIDIVEVRAFRRAENSTSRDILDAGTGVFTAGLVNKTLAFNLDSQTSVNGASAINYKTGTAAVSPVAPATTAGYIKIAEVLVGTSVTTLDADKINDTRKLMGIGGVVTASFEVWIDPTVSPKGSLKNVVAPPGVRIFAGGGATGTAEDLRSALCYVVAGSPRWASVAAHCQALESDGTGVQPSQVVRYNTRPQLFTLTSVETGIAADATRSDVTQKFAVGQSAVLFYATPDQNNSVDAALSSLVRWHFNVSLGY